MADKKKTGFQRLQGLASAGALAGIAAIGVLPAGSVRAAPGFSSSRTYSSTKGSVKNSWIWRATCYQSVLSDESLTTSKGLSLNKPEDTGMGIEQGYLNTDISGTIKEWPEAFGEVRSGGGSAGILGLAVNGSAPSGCGGGATLDSADPDLDTWSATHAGVATGIDLTRKFTYFSFRPIVRGFFSFTNTTGSDIDVIAHIMNSLSSSTDTIVVASSDGNTAHDTADAWVITSDDASGSNNLPMVTSWTGASDELVAAYGDGSKVNKGHMVTRHELTIPAGETVSLVAFIELNADASTAQSQASDFADISAMEAAGLFDGLSAGEVASIANGPLTTSKNNKKKDDDKFLGSTSFEFLLGLGLLGLKRRKR